MLLTVVIVVGVFFFLVEYVTELISDARQISQYLGKKEIDVEDLRLAKEMAEKAVNFGPRPRKQVRDRHSS